ncbi:MAG: hypothetical protein RKP46_09940 [Candidatus Accumulibacter sp.]|nr:hypothetical protein [Accumulibacter sp.]MDS4014664.1 hypothetical protein [Accumulibacter sp.]
MKVGYDIDDWTLRGGYSSATQPIPGSQTFINSLAPDVVEKQPSIGAA